MTTMATGTGQTKLPTGWKWVKLGNAYEIQKGRKALKVFSSRSENNLRYLQIADLHGRVTRNFASDPKGVIASESDILIAWDGANAGTVSYGMSGLIGSTIALLRPKQSDMHTPFVGMFLQSQFKNFNTNFTYGSTIPHIEKGLLLSVEIPVPPMEEQRRIAGLLNEQMAMVGQAKKAAEERLNIAQALPNVFTKQLFEGEAARGWPVKHLGEITQLQTGFAFKSDCYVPQGMRLLRNANVSPGYIDWTEVVHLPSELVVDYPKFSLKLGDIVLSLDRPVISTGLKVARVDEIDLPCLLVQRVGRFLLSDSVDSLFLFNYLQSEVFRRQITGHDQSLGVPHISPNQVLAASIRVPPLEEQQRNSSELLYRTAAVKTLEESIQQELDTIEAMPSALLRKAFSGGL
jgi:type I restriction enzyme, S subunit